MALVQCKAVVTKALSDITLEGVINSCANSLGEEQLKKEQSITSAFTREGCVYQPPHWVEEVNSILPLCLKKLCPSVNTFILIISPLISLMEDQISSLKCSAVLLHKDLDSAALVENSHVFVVQKGYCHSPSGGKH